MPKIIEWKKKQCICVVSIVAAKSSASTTTNPLGCRFCIDFMVSRSIVLFSVTNLFFRFVCILESIFRPNLCAQLTLSAHEMAFRISAMMCAYDSTLLDSGSGQWNAKLNVSASLQFRFHSVKRLSQKRARKGRNNMYMYIFGKLGIYFCLFQMALVNEIYIFRI